MIFVTASDEVYKAGVEWSVENMKGLGYRYITYDLGGLGFGRDVTAVDVPKDLKFGYDKEWELSERGRTGNHPCLFKFDAMWDVLLHDAKPGEVVIWLDADAFVYQRMDEIDNDNYDVGLTMRPHLEFNWPESADHEWTGYFNGGVVIIRNTENGIRWARDWTFTIPILKEEIKKLGWDGYKDPKRTYSEQWALNRMTSKYVTWEDRGSIVNIDGVRLWVANGYIYNAYGKKEERRIAWDNRQVKIEHMKTGRGFPKKWPPVGERK